ncbi:carbohydrate ABC transporter permease [Paenibacillus sp. IB182496]|uniref:Carbohydrate ABC transporter permease n=1 Tax=Paenibacillus sabuli TaxID=2772509 RepID=A0A927BQG0_9BACL|nr:carbohydrate ABC transporter permease [Paenibacillus sabuli]MBD2844056.1 carbohydrate ABC transporter permease [Paenibacillus sabuli]
MNDISWSRRSFLIANYLFLGGLAVLCIMPMVHVLAISFSSSTAAEGNMVKLLPVDFTLNAYRFALTKPEFLNSFTITAQRMLLGVSMNLLMTILIAYPLAKESHAFKWRNFYVWAFVLTMLFGGGLIPTYMIVNMTGLIDSIWALVLPGAVPVFNVVLLLNFFRTLPKELEEAAYIDGASHLRTLWHVYLPLSKPALATITLFISVGHWNEWFHGILYMNSPAHYPLSSYLQNMVVMPNSDLLSSTDYEAIAKINQRTLKAAQIFLAALPILLLYPFLQKYFVKGIVLGSVKE